MLSEDQGSLSVKLRAALPEIGLPHPRAPASVRPACYLIFLLGELSGEPRVQ